MDDPTHDYELPSDRDRDPSSRARWMSPVLAVASRIADAVHFGRLRGPVATLALVGLAMTIGSGAIAATGPRWPRWLYPHDPTVRQEHVERAGSKLAALVHEGRRPVDERIGILIGSSSLMLGIDGETLTEQSGIPIRWLELCAGGANADDLTRLFRLVLWSDLKPECIILGLHPDMLAETTDCLGPDGDEIYLVLDSLSRHASSGLLGESLADIEAVIAAYTDLAFPSRTLVNYRLRSAIYEAKCRVFRAVGMRIDAMFAPGHGVWAVPGPSKRNGPLRFRQGYFKNGRYDSRSYAPDNPNSRSLASLIDEAARRGIRLLVLITPATRTDKEMQPPQAERCLQAVLMRQRGTDPPVLNLRSEFDDNSFGDLFHLSAEGRAVASEATRRIPENPICE